MCKCPIFFLRTMTDLATSSLRSVNPMYYVGFSTATIVASIILFQGLNTDDPANSLSLLAGFITTFLGVHLLELSRTPSSSGENGYVRAANSPGDEEVGLQTMFDAEQDEYEHVGDDLDSGHEQSPLHHNPRGSIERGRGRTS